MIDLGPLCATIDYQFKNIELLEIALRHRSAGLPHNERLEFLGDAILSVVIAEATYLGYSQATEGDLSRMRSLLVNGVVLAKIARELHLGAYLTMGPGEQKSGGHERESTLADALEALIGAIFLDGSIEACRHCILHWYGNRLQQISEKLFSKDSKSLLQEWAQAHKFPLPRYHANVSGKPHELVFHVVCQIEGLPDQAEGVSTSRRRAEQLAARHYLDQLP